MRSALGRPLCCWHDDAGRTCSWPASYFYFDKPLCADHASKLTALLIGGNIYDPSHFTEWRYTTEGCHGCQD